MELTVKDLVALFGVPERTVYGWVRESDIPHYRVQDQYRFNRVDLLEWAAVRGIAMSPTAVQSADGAVDFCLADVIEAGGILHEVPGSTRMEVIAGVVRAMRLPEGLDTEFVLDVLLAREQLGSTGIGEGIAIPHARNPIVMHVQKPLIALAFLAAPVDFGALDGQPVHTVFTMITPTIRVHLSLLSRLSLALRAEPWRQVIAARADRNQILGTLREVEAGWAQGSAGRP